MAVLVDDIGKMSDARLSLLRRHYTLDGNFNFFYGLAYQTFHVKIGSAFLNRTTYLPGMDYIDTATLGGVIGIGSRWVIDNNITLGIDWISLSQGLVRVRHKGEILNRTTNASDREIVDDLLKITSYFPRIVLLKLQAGISF